MDLNFANSAIPNQQMLGRDRERYLTIYTSVMALEGRAKDRVRKDFIFEFAIFLTLEQQFTRGATELIHSSKNPKIALKYFKTLYFTTLVFGFFQDTEICIK